MSADDWVDGDGWISQDSDFYGTETQQRSLLKRARNSDAQVYLKYKDFLPYNIAAQHSSKPAPSYYNPFEGRPEIGRQLDESVADFVKRLRPSQTATTRQHENDERQIENESAWIWIANPYEPKREDDANIPEFVLKGTKALHEFSDVKTSVEAENDGKAKATVTKKLKPFKDKLEAEIKELAIECKLLSGKWMLFPSLKDVDRVWRTVAEAVIDGQLGPSAKVARAEYSKTASRSHLSGRGTGKGEEDGSQSRLICVYTQNFSDEPDVLHVLKGLVSVGLVTKNDPRGIWYKADAYTWLDINSSNEYGLRASLYSSKEMLRDT